MAPELFQEGATQSTASDFWALGCILYECYTGRPPFVNPSFNELVRSILHAEPTTPKNASPPFADLLKRLLDKNPATRMSWLEMLTHPFWRFSLRPMQMPQEPALLRFIELHRLAPRLGENVASEREEQSKVQERARMCASSCSHLPRLMATSQQGIATRLCVWVHLAQALTGCSIHAIIECTSTIHFNLPPCPALSSDSIC